MVLSESEIAKLREEFLADRLWVKSSRFVEPEHDFPGMSYPPGPPKPRL